MPWRDVAAPDEVKAGTILEVEVAGSALALYRIDGRVYATAATCPHAAAWLAQGFLDGDHIRCPRHGGSFHILTGVQRAGPACAPLRTYRVRIEGGRVLIELP